MAKQPGTSASDSSEPQGSREVRVFLSSTFRDFMEERELLAKQVFPSLNRRARERGVELVEVDLRWGVTQEQAEDGHALEICLKEIERCRPYFIGMLGDSYGSITPPQRQLLKAAPELLKQRQWLDGRIGKASYTELEIEHSLQVLRNPAMEGRAFFYFRDPAWSDPRAEAGEEGWRSETPEEREKLERLRQKIRKSGYPLVEGLQTPQAIADQIEADLWTLIERLFPEDEQPDALEQENRKHASYRRSRTGEDQYIGGQRYISQLEEWIESGEQQILITGESGSGKSALIANWMEAHGQSHPKDVLYAHHLGCTNDANDIEPMLTRLIENASRLLIAEEQITAALAIPSDWWELVASVADTLRRLSAWCQKSGLRWIWILDGLDRLNPGDQNALPWLPEVLPEGIHIIASTLRCSAHEILEQRRYNTLRIEALQRSEQEQLITQVLGHYTKQLDPALKEEVLQHQLASSPLFLRVLLEELRQCGRFETLKDQLAFYLISKTIDELYEKVIERLENDGGNDVVRKAVSAIWASRAGLTEAELLGITDIAPLEWAPIDLALEKAFGRNGNRLIFDHEFLRIAVENRYLPSEEQQRQAHSELADWYEAKDQWTERDAEEMPWQWQQASRLEDLRRHLLNPVHLAYLNEYRGSQETINYWLAVKGRDDRELDELITPSLDEEIKKRRNSPEDAIWIVDSIASLYETAGLYRKPLIKLRSLSLELEEASGERSEELMLASLGWLALSYERTGDYNKALPLLRRCLEAKEKLLGLEHPGTLDTVHNLGFLYNQKGDYEQAEILYYRCLEVSERLRGIEHPDTLATVSNLAGLLHDKGDHKKAEDLYKRALEGCERLLGPEHPDTLITVANMALLYSDQGDYKKAEAYYMRDLKSSEKLLGLNHPETLTTVSNLAVFFHEKGDYEKAELLYKRALEGRERLLGPDHRQTIITIGNLGRLYTDKGNYKQAEILYDGFLEACEKLLGSEHPNTLAIINNLAGFLQDKGDYDKAESLYKRALEGREQLLGSEHRDTITTIGNLGILYSIKGYHKQAELFCMRCLETLEQLLGSEHPETLTAMKNTGWAYKRAGNYKKAEFFHTQALVLSEKTKGEEHPETLSIVQNLAEIYEKTGEIEKALAYSKRVGIPSKRLRLRAWIKKLTNSD